MWRTFAFERVAPSGLSFPIGGVPFFHLTQQSRRRFRRRRRHLFFPTTTRGRREPENGRTPLARGESRISGVEFASRAVEQFRCAFFFAGTRARKRERERRTPESRSHDQPLTDLVFFARVFGGFFRTCNGLVETRKRVSGDSRFVGVEISDECDFFYSERVGECQRVAHSKRSARDFWIRYLLGCEGTPFLNDTARARNEGIRAARSICRIQDFRFVILSMFRSFPLSRRVAVSVFRIRESGCLGTSRSLF